MHNFIVVSLISAVAFFILSCSANREIKKQFERFHENEMRSTLEEYCEYIDTHDDFWVTQGNINQIYLSDDFINKLKKNYSIHSEHHSIDILPRNSKAWKIWMHNWKSIVNNKKIEDRDNYYISKLKEKDNKKPLTLCPFCLAEQDGNLSEMDKNWKKTYLFKYKIDKRIDSLLSFMKNDEIKAILDELETYIKTNEMFGQKETSNWIYKFSPDNDDVYYASLTKKYIDLREKISILHNKFHVFYEFGNDTAEETLFYYFNKANGKYLNFSKPVPFCPECIVIHEAVMNGKYTPNTKNFSWNYGDEYIWKNDNFAIKSFYNYSVEKNKQKKEAAERKRIRELPLYDVKKIYSDIIDNEIAARKKYDKKRLKIGGRIEKIKLDYAVLSINIFDDVHLYMPTSTLEKLHSGQYIQFFATIRFLNKYYDEDEELNGGANYALMNGELIE